MAPSGHGREFTQPSLRLFLHICSSVLRCSLPLSPSPLISDERETVYLPYPNSLSSSTRFALLLNNNLIPQLQSDKCKCKFSSFVELQYNFECENRRRSLLRFQQTPQNALLSARFNLKRFSCGQMASRSLNRISSFVPRVRKRYFRRSRNRVRATRPPSPSPLTKMLLAPFAVDHQNDLSRTALLSDLAIDACVAFNSARENELISMFCKG